MRRLSIPPRLLAWYRRHTVDALLGATAIAVVLALGAGYVINHHPTRASAAAHVAQQVRDAHGEVDQLERIRLSEAEYEALREKPHFTPHWNHVETDAGTERRTLKRGDEIALRVSYSDGYFMLSDVWYRVTDHDVDPIDQISDTGAVVAGGPGEAMVAGCCEGGDAPVTLALRDRDPKAPSAAWSESSEVDLDLQTGDLAFTQTGGTDAIVSVPSGKYRLRVSGRNAHEFEQDDERFLIELWPRTRDARLAVLRRAT
ncbi:hypothetical protein [Baekduia sp. Peel2402]|uniref:hypothetical protein n=1 Tax=Baekduia sp. Peel2402 TaxID=3458296 RepID=UPI00403EA72C